MAATPEQHALMVWDMGLGLGFRDEIGIGEIRRREGQGTSAGQTRSHAHAHGAGGSTGVKDAAQAPSLSKQSVKPSTEAN